MKKTIQTITLAATLALGATFANAGIIIGSQPGVPPCSPQTDGILVSDMFTTIVSQIEGIIFGGAPTPCSQSDGIIIGG